MDYTEIEKIKIWLKNHLSEEKYKHSLETANNAKRIASMVGYDIEKAYIAGLIHDCAKCFKHEELHYVTKAELEAPKTLHAPVGVYIAQKQFNINDLDILSSIRWHTIAKKDMSMLEKIVFLSDKIREEFGEKYFQTGAFEYIEEHGIDAALKKSIQSGISYLRHINAKVNSSTIEAYNSL